MKPKTQAIVAVSLFTIGLVASVYNIHKRNTIVNTTGRSEDEKKIIAMSGISLLVFGIGAGMTISNSVEIVSLFKKG